MLRCLELTKASAVDVLRVAKRAFSVVAVSLVIALSVQAAWNSPVVADDNPPGVSGKTQDAAQSASNGQAAAPTPASSAPSLKGKKRSPKSPPIDLATAISRMESSLKEAEAAKAKSDWGVAFQATVKAWEVARFYRDDVRVKPKFKSIEAALEALGQKANQQYEREIKSPRTVHVEK